MRAPEFWYPEDGRAGLTATVLTPLGWLYGAAGQWQRATGSPRRTVAKVICVGNLTAGGTGKTPVCLALNDLLTADGTRTAFLTRGYGGKTADPTRIDLSAHGFDVAGDEALLLANAAPTYISPTRRRGGEAASRDGAEVIIMDDGFQNPAIIKTLSLVVIDAAAGFGNRRMIPAGPLRESIRLGLRRADAIILVGELSHERDRDLVKASGIPVFRASVNVDPRAEFDLTRPVVAFTGIGRPQKFFDTLASQGFNVVEAVPYPDHHPFKVRDLEWLEDLRDERSADLITTSKDYVRLPADFRAKTRELPIRVLFEDPESVAGFLAEGLRDQGATR